VSVGQVRFELAHRGRHAMIHAIAAGCATFRCQIRSQHSWQHVRLGRPNGCCLRSAASDPFGPVVIWSARLNGEPRWPTVSRSGTRSLPSQRF